jgi:nucleotide-binding universal stress UspA family protein
MFKKILVAVDGSDVSRGGLIEAAALAADQAATLFVAYVVEGMPAGWSYYVDQQFRPERVDLLLQGLQASGQRLLDGACSEARERGAAAEAVMIHARGRPFAEALLDEAHRIGADLVVLGTHGRDGVERILKGSDAESLLRSSDIPLLVVRKAMPAERAKDVPGQPARRLEVA